MTLYLLYKVGTISFDLFKVLIIVESVLFLLVIIGNIKIRKLNRDIDKIVRTMFEDKDTDVKKNT